MTTPINIERLARMAETDNWLHETRRPWRPSLGTLLLALALHALVFAAGIGAMRWYGLL